MRALDYKSVSTVAAHVDNLIAKGYVVKSDHSARSLEILAGEAQFRDRTVVQKVEQKWLVELVKAKFALVETEKPTPRQLDELFVLVGTLQILGFEAAARSLKPKLREFKQQIDEV